MLDAGNKLISINNISTGSLTEAIVHPREVFEPAVKHLAAKIIIAHNHPSGELDPSPEDIKITHRLVAVGELLGINVVDHIIISSNGYISLREKGLL